MHHLVYRWLLFAILILVGGSCKKDEDVPPPGASSAQSGCTASVTDIDGNVCFVVSISDQCRMAETLRTTHYADGTAIPLTFLPLSWVDAGTARAHARCAYQNSATNTAVYGYHYNWYAATNPHGICPQGWHVPTDAEWQRLVIVLGADELALDGEAQNVGGRLKSTSTLWQQPNFGATNTSGFSGLPGGNRNGSSGDFSALGYFGVWWSTTGGGNPDIALYLRLNHDYVGVTRNSQSKTHGYCLRCLQD